MHLVEGVDYLFNRYAFLGLDANASDVEIAAAIKIKKSENHPDRYTKASQEARNLAARQWELLEKCETMLTSPETREAFDELLSRFEEESPHLISTTGTPKLDPSRRRMDLDAMLGEPKSTEAHEIAVAQVADFNPNMLTILEQVYRGNPSDSTTRDVYREILAKGLLH